MANCESGKKYANFTILYVNINRSYIYLSLFKLNKAYGPYLLVEVVTSLCLLTIELWGTYFRIKYYSERLIAVITGSTVWAGYQILKILRLTKVCESTVATGKTTTANLLQELGLNENNSPATKREVSNQNFTNFLLRIRFCCRFFIGARFLNSTSTGRAKC